MTQTAKSAVPEQEPLAATDGELLMRFVRHHDRAAIEELVHKHASMVMTVCRQVLGSRPDAEDAFQATFLILAKRAASIEQNSSAAGWLYRVAHRTALRIAAQRRRTKTEPLRAEPSSEPDVFSIIHQRDLQQTLHEELARLPLAYREPILLLYFADKSREQIANELECSEAAVKGRLSRGRKLLRLALARRGIGLSVAVGACLAAQPASYAVAHDLLDQTIVACTMLVQPGAGPVPCSPEVIQLANTGVRAMLFASFAKIAVGPVTIAVAVLALAQLPGEQAPLPADGNAAPVQLTLAAETPAAAAAGAPAAEAPSSVIAAPATEPATIAWPTVPAAPHNSGVAAYPEDAAAAPSQAPMTSDEVSLHYDATMLQAMEAYYRAKAMAYEQRIEAKATEARAFEAHESDRERLLGRARQLEAFAAQSEYKAESSLLATKAEQLRRRREQMLQTDDPRTTAPARPGPPSADVLQPGDRVMIQAVNVSESDPIAREFTVQPNGTVALGPTYGRVQVTGLSAEEAEQAIRGHLEEMFQSPKVQVIRSEARMGRTDLEALQAEVRTLRMLLENYAGEDKYPAFQPADGHKSRR